MWIGGIRVLLVRDSSLTASICETNTHGGINPCIFYKFYFLHVVHFTKK